MPILLYMKVARILCPTSTQAAKAVNKYISIMENSRKLLDEGTPLDHLGYRNPAIGEYNDSEASVSLDSINSSFLNSRIEE